RLAERLRGWCGGQRWAVSVVNEGGAPTVAEIRARDEAEAMARAVTHPAVIAVLAAFPGASVVAARRIPPPAEPVTQAASDPGTTHDDGTSPVAAAEEWDPFEDEE
ncbi:MAG: DNA polymerase III subunit gamma/tau, partial [Paracoccus sp. (in: a-proteobacteria)]|nr:DNA polymerase III subunit gamma/tau [Paracoccus sp. (in: a-proteobacteria)]